MSRRIVNRPLFLVVCLLFTAQVTFSAGWTRQQSGTMAWLKSVYFLNRSHGWAAGSGGALLETKDSGTTWRQVNLLTKDTLEDVHFADEMTGWLVVERDLLKLKSNSEPQSYLLKTQDGGATWKQILLNDSENARLVRAVFTDADRGWVFGESGAVFATEDGGFQWTRQASPTKHLLLGGAFVDSAHGWLAGAAGTILQTNNGGLSWHTSIVRDGREVRFNAVSFVGGRLGWAVGGGGHIFATTDGGLTWFAQDSPTDSDLFDAKFIDAAEGWAVGAQGSVLHTTDGGIHWFAERSGTTHTLNRLFFVDRNHGWTVGFGGTILTFGDSGTPRLKSS